LAIGVTLGRLPATLLVRTVRTSLRQDGEQAWKGTLVNGSFLGHKAMFERGVTEAGCVDHARRKFYELASDTDRWSGACGSEPTTAWCDAP
jgi:hypothetical protein